MKQNLSTNSFARNSKNLQIPTNTTTAESQVFQSSVFDGEKLSSETANVVWRKFHFSRFNELTFISSQALRQGGEETEKKFSDEPAVNCGGNKGRKLLQPAKSASAVIQFRHKDFRVGCSVSKCLHQLRTEARSGIVQPQNVLIGNVSSHMMRMFASTTIASEAD